MSREQALAFLKHAAENTEMQEKIAALAAKEGYSFSVEELSDAELEAAAGGVLGNKQDLLKPPVTSHKSESVVATDGVLKF